MKLIFSNLSCGYGERTVISRFCAEASSGDIFCILGPNGVGKTTLFKTVLGLLPAQDGAITLDGQNLLAMSDQERARFISYVPQSQESPFPYAVIDLVLMGRAPYLGMFEQPGKEDYRIAAEALELMGIAHLADKACTDLSGGERQMVMIARVVAQQTPVLVLDEPTSNLDFGNQVMVLRYIRQLAKKGYIVIMTTHAPEHALLCRSIVSLLRRDGSFLTDVSEKIITPEILKETYGVRVQIVDVPLESGDMLSACVPII